MNADLNHLHPSHELDQAPASSTRPGFRQQWRGPNGLSPIFAGAAMAMSRIRCHQRFAP